MKQATLHQLKVFEAVVRHSSFTHAAEELFLTQPTVSMQVKQLAKAVGLPLFEQIGKRLYLTDAGQELLATCQEIFKELSLFEIAVADLKGLKRGYLRLAVITTAKYVIPRLLGPFCQHYSGIDVSLKVTNHEHVLERLANNRDDLYILSQPPEDLDVSSHPFVENPWLCWRRVIIHWFRRKNIPLRRLAEEPFIVHESGSSTRKAVQKLFDEHGISIKVKLELGSNEAIKQAIAGGLGISVLSLHTLALEGTTSQLTILEVEDFPIQLYWYVIYPTGKQLSVTARIFFEYLLNEGKEIAQTTLQSIF